MKFNTLSLPAKTVHFKLLFFFSLEYPDQTSHVFYTFTNDFIGIQKTVGVKHAKGCNLYCDVINGFVWGIVELQRSKNQRSTEVDSF